MFSQVSNHLSDDSIFTNTYYEDLQESELTDNQKDRYSFFISNYFSLRVGRIEKVKESSWNENIDKNLMSYYYFLKGFEEIKNDNDRNKIESLFEKALKEKEAEVNKWLHLELYKFWYNENLEKSIYHLEKALEIDPKFNEAIILESFLLDPIDQCDLIINRLENLSKEYIDPRAMTWLGNAYMNCNQITKAQKIIEKSIQIKPSSDSYHTLGLLYSDHYDVDNYKDLIINSFEKSISLDIENTFAINDYAWFLFDINSIKEAEQHFLRLLEIDKDQEVYNQVIEFYFFIKEFNKADEYIQASKELNEINFMNLGYEILLLSLKNNDTSDLDRTFRASYSDFEIEWLESLLIKMSR